jgi:hypothetical protein
VKNLGFLMDETSTVVKLLEPCSKTSSLGSFSLRHWRKPSEEAWEGTGIRWHDKKLTRNASAKPLRIAIFCFSQLARVLLCLNTAWPKLSIYNELLSCATCTAAKPEL